MKHGDAVFGVCGTGFLLIPGLQLSDWMDLRRDFELWTFNIVDTVQTIGTLEVGLMYFLNYAMARYGPHRLMCLNKPLGARREM